MKSAHTMPGGCRNDLPGTQVRVRVEAASATATAAVPAPADLAVGSTFGARPRLPWALVPVLLLLVGVVYWLVAHAGHQIADPGYRRQRANAEV